MDTEELEKMLDSTSLMAVIFALAEICHEKAEHVQTNWQDKELAKTWSKAGYYLERVSNTTTIFKAGK